jgi:hypothetical protein
MIRIPQGVSGGFVGNFGQSELECWTDEDRSVRGSVDGRSWL